MYLFSEEGSYLGRSGTTDSAGKVSFIEPIAGYTLRIDVNGEQFWTAAINVLPGQDNGYALNLTNNGLALDATNNPRPTRWDGETPVYQPLLAMNAGSLTGLLSQITTQLTIADEPRAFWYIADHLSTAQLITDEQGDVAWQDNFKPLGGVDVVVDQLENRFRFPGQIVDPESVLYYNWHRFYDPETGRYISADPIGLAGGMNLYAYVQNDPVNSVDPWGLKIVLHGNKKNYDKAINHLYTKMYDHLNDDKMPQIDIWITPDATDGSTATDTRIVWDPYSAERTANGGSQSPALGLAHETLHVLYYLAGKTDSDCPEVEEEIWDYPIEKAIITGLEAKIAKAAGEDVRTDHKARSYKVSCPTCR